MFCAHNLIHIITLRMSIELSGPKVAISPQFVANLPVVRVLPVPPGPISKESKNLVARVSRIHNINPVRDI